MRQKPGKRQATGGLMKGRDERERRGREVWDWKRKRETRTTFDPVRHRPQFIRIASARAEDSRPIFHSKPDATSICLSTKGRRQEAVGAAIT